MSQPQQQTAKLETNGARLSVDVPSHITAVRFINAISFAGTIDSATSDTGGLAAAHRGITIEPAYLSGGQCVVCKPGERADGVRLSRKLVDRTNGAPVTRLEVAYVPQGNIGEVKFGE